MNAIAHLVVDRSKIIDVLTEERGLRTNFDLKQLGPPNNHNAAEQQSTN